MGAWVGVHEVLTAAGAEEEAYFRRFARDVNAPVSSLICGYDCCRRTFASRRGLSTHVTMMHRRKK